MAMSAPIDLISRQIGKIQPRILRKPDKDSRILRSVSV